jgi:hypothetical protein
MEDYSHAYFNNGHRESTKDERSEENDDERRGDDDLSSLLLEFQMEGEGVGNCSSEATEPHDEQHFLSDLMRPELVHEVPQGKDIQGSTRQAETETPNHERDLDSVMETEDG